MKYYLHDTSAFEDEKVCELFINFGYEGVGLFYVILEKLGKQEKPIKTTVLKSQLKVGKKLEKCWSFMESLGIISSNNGETFNKQILNFSETYRIKKEKTLKKVTEWRKNQDDIENVTSYKGQCNPPKVKESKVKESKEIIKIEKQTPLIPFELENSEFIENWNTLINESKWKTKSFKALEQTLNRLKNYDVLFSIELLENAISGNYQGVTFPDTNEKYLKWQNQFKQPGQIKTTHGQPVKESAVENNNRVARELIIKMSGNE